MHPAFRRIFAAAAPIIVLAAMAGPLRAESPGAGLQLLTRGLAHHAPALSTQVEIEVSGMLARTTLTQSFSNPSGDWVEGRYTFPLPDGVTVDELEIRIGERRILGELREKSDARAVYRKARTAGRSAGLVEQQRANLFSTALANIAPGETITVRIGYSEIIDYRHGRFRLRFPTTALPRYANRPAGDRPVPADQGNDPLRIATRPAGEDAAGLELQVTLRPGIEIGPLQSLHHRVRALPGEGPLRIELADPELAAGRDFELEWAPARPERLNGALLIESHSDRAHALLMLVPPETFRPHKLARDLVLVIDQSGSMQGEAFEQAREAVRLALDRIGPHDRFNLIAFNHRAQPLFDRVVEPDRGNLNRAYRFLDSLRAEGGTEIDAALAHAVNEPGTPGRLRQVVFATDGAMANEGQVLELVRRRFGTTRLFAIGIGHGVNDAFLRRTARAGRGTLTRIADPRDIGERMGELLRQLEGPVLTDIEVDWPGGTVAEIWPDPLPDLYAGEPLLMLARLDRPEQSLAGRVRVRAFSDLSPLEMNWPLDRYLNAPGVARAWARSRIEGFETLLPGQIDEQLRRDEMLLTALDYGIVSDQTSLVAVDRTPRRSREAELKRRQIALAAPADRAGGEVALLAMPATDAGTMQALLRGLAILLILGLLLLNRRLRDVAPTRPGTLESRRTRP